MTYDPTRRCLTIGLLAALMLPIAARPGEPVKLPLEQRQVVDELGRKVTYYIGHPKKPTAPIMLMIQGSGCAAVMHIDGPKTYSTLFNLLPFAGEGEFTVVAVEKPFSGGGPGGTATSCGAEFNQDFTAERWLVALRAALGDARKSPWVDRSRTLAFGFSEGAVMADMLAGRDKSITDVIAMSGSGTTQLFDFVALAYKRCFDVSACLAQIDENLRAVMAKPDSSTDFAWGHPHKRWTSFFNLDPGAELLKSDARIYIAFGTNDESVPALSEEHAVARLLLAGKDVTVRRVPNAGHSLSESAQLNVDDLSKEYRAALKWFWERPARPDLAGQWILRVEDKDHQVRTTLTVEFTKDAARGCMSGNWLQVKVISVTGDSRFYPASDALSYEIENDDLTIGRNEVCDAYLMLGASLKNEPVSGRYYSLGFAGSNPKGYFTLSRAPR